MTRADSLGWYVIGISLAAGGYAVARWSEQRRLSKLAATLGATQLAGGGVSSFAIDGFLLELREEYAEGYHGLSVLLRGQGRIPPWLSLRTSERPRCFRALAPHSYFRSNLESYLPPATVAELDDLAVKLAGADAQIDRFGSPSAIAEGTLRWAVDDWDWSPPTVARLAVRIQQSIDMARLAERLSCAYDAAVREASHHREEYASSYYGEWFSRAEREQHRVAVRDLAARLALYFARLPLGYCEPPPDLGELRARPLELLEGKSAFAVARLDAILRRAEQELTCRRHDYNDADDS